MSVGCLKNAHAGLPSSELASPSTRLPTGGARGLQQLQLKILISQQQQSKEVHFSFLTGAAKTQELYRMRGTILTGRSSSHTDSLILDVGYAPPE